jgi:arylsulfatase I/J
MWCIPSRSATLSGRLPVHVFQGGGGACNEHFGIPRGMTVIGTKLKSAGYSTHQFGKWDAGSVSHRRCSHFHPNLYGKIFV